jgi:Zn finger protein HypA/HybF involved in hydrogenase expression
MKTLATLGIEEAPGLAEYLKTRGIRATVSPRTEDSGLEVGDVQVEDAVYEAACEAVDQRMAELEEEAEKNTSRRCPSCDSPHVEYLQNPDNVRTLTKIEGVFRCLDCGRAFVPRR